MIYHRRPRAIKALQFQDTPERLADFGDLTKAIGIAPLSVAYAKPNKLPILKFFYGEKSVMLVPGEWLCVTLGDNPEVFHLPDVTFQALYGPDSPDAHPGKQAPAARLWDAVETAWGIIANASGGDWKRESDEWQQAADRFRDEYSLLCRLAPEPSKNQNPIDRIRWMKATALTANGYNPNHVARPELLLLQRSIMTNGWIQPILATPEGYIIDGFHRWLLATTDPAIKERDAGLVPVAILHLTTPEAMLLTIRINRAKGTHSALKMSGIVKSLVEDHGLELQQVADGIGAHLNEISLLMQKDVFAAKDIENYAYSTAWTPEDFTK